MHQSLSAKLISQLCYRAPLNLSTRATISRTNCTENIAYRIKMLKALNPDAVVFSTFYYKGSVKAGQCQDWRQYTESALNPPFDDLFFTSLEYSVASFDYDLNDMQANSTYSCSEVSAVTQIITLLSSPSPAGASAISCNKATWNIFTCSSTTVLCVNCRPQCGSPSCPAVQAFCFAIYIESLPVM